MKPVIDSTPERTVKHRLVRARYRPCSPSRPGLAAEMPRAGGRLVPGLNRRS